MLFTMFVVTPVLKSEDVFSKMPPKLVKATIEDMPEVARLFRVSRESELPYLPKLHTHEEDLEYFSSVMFPNKRIDLLKDKDKLLGFACSDADWIHHLYLLPEAIGKGYGAKLLKSARTYRTRMKLWVFKKNERAIKFYEKHGFHRIKETDGSENEEEEPDILMHWPEVKLRMIRGVRSYEYGLKVAIDSEFGDGASRLFGWLTSLITAVFVERSRMHLPIIRTLGAVLCACFLSGADATAWHEFAVPVPGKLKELKLAVRQFHPYLAEYEYKVSGRLPSGKPFTHKLATQCGGSPFLMVDYIPDLNRSEGYIRFKQVEAQSHVLPNFLNLETGLLEQKGMAVAHARSVGFLDNHLNYYKASSWGEAHAQAELYLHNSKFKEALQLARKEVAEARAVKDNDVIATALFDLALVLQVGKQGTVKDIEEAYSEAIQKAYVNEEKLPDDPRIAPKIKILAGLEMFYEKQCRFAEAENLVEQRITLAKRLKDEKLVAEISFDLARLKLLQNHTADAIGLIKSLKAASATEEDAKEKEWKELYPYVALLEHDIKDGFERRSAGRECGMTGTFEIQPDNRITNLKSLSQHGDHPELPASMSIFFAFKPIKAPFPIDHVIQCHIDMSTNAKGAKVSITPYGAGGETSHE